MLAGVELLRHKKQACILGMTHGSSATEEKD